MITIIIVLFNYFVWLFAGVVPMQHLLEAPMVCVPLGILEIVSEILLICMGTTIVENYKDYIEMLKVIKRR